MLSRVCTVAWLITHHLTSEKSWCIVIGIITRPPSDTYLPAPKNLQVCLSYVFVGFDDGLIVILWRFAATYVRAKHIRAEMLNSNSLVISGRP